MQVMSLLSAIGVALSACTTSPFSQSAPDAAGAAAPAATATAPASGNIGTANPATPDGGVNAAAAGAAAPSVAQRDLTPQEKKVIIGAIASSLKDPASAKYRWAKFPVVTPDDDVNYCATVDAKSPYAAYNGRQAYIVEARLAGGKVTSAVMGLIAGGKDASIVTNMCAKYGLDPNNAT
jgi:hypothetical protein